MLDTGYEAPSWRTASADVLAAAAFTLARSFEAGATMWCVAPQWPAHARHVAVEFVHPVIVGKRALPALEVEGPDYAGTIRLLARPGDVLLALSSTGDTGTDELLRRAEAWGLTRILLGAGPRPATPSADQVVWLEELDRSQAAHTGDMVLLYHLLWELTHVVFEHPGLLIPEASCAEGPCITCSDDGRVAEVRVVGESGSAEVMAGGMVETIDASLVEPLHPGDLVLVHAGVALAPLGVQLRQPSEVVELSSEPTGFLYPFIEAEERDADALLTDLALSAGAKIGESRALRATTIEQCGTLLEGAAEAMTERFARGGRLFTFGNGGSATDAEGTAQLFCDPPFGEPLPALSLVDDRAVLTALANDVGFDLVFSRQLIAHARSGDIAIGFSTSGDSRNVLRALDEAHDRGLLTVGLCGSAGGSMAGSDAVGYCMVVRSESIHRIQEAQNALVWRVWSMIQQHLNDRGRP